MYRLQCKNEPKGVKADTMCIAYRSKANTNEVMGMKHETKGNHSKQGSCLLNVTYYKLRAGKHLAYYIIGQGIEGYRVSGAKEVLNQALMLPRVCRVRKTMGKKPKIVARAGLCSGQRHGSTMTNTVKDDLFDMIQDVMQANHRNGAPGIDESHRMVHG